MNCLSEEETIFHLHEIQNGVARIGFGVEQILEVLMLCRLVEGVTGSVKLLHHRLTLGRVGKVGHSVLQNFGAVRVFSLWNGAKVVDG